MRRHQRVSCQRGRKAHNIDRRWPRRRSAVRLLRNGCGVSLSALVERGHELRPNFVAPIGVKRRRSIGHACNGFARGARDRCPRKHAPAVADVALLLCHGRDHELAVHRTADRGAQRSWRGRDRCRREAATRSEPGDPPLLGTRTPATTREPLSTTATGDQQPQVRREPRRRERRPHIRRAPTTIPIPIRPQTARTTGVVADADPVKPAARTPNSSTTPSPSAPRTRPAPPGHKPSRSTPAAHRQPPPRSAF